MCYYDLAISSSRLSNLSCKLLDHYLLSACMPHVTGHFCVCHVELWLLFHDFYPCVQCTQYPVPCHDFFRDKKFGFLDKIHFFIDIFLSLNFWICHEIEFFLSMKKSVCHEIEFCVSMKKLVCHEIDFFLSRNRIFQKNSVTKYRDKSVSR